MKFAIPFKCSECGHSSELQFKMDAVKIAKKKEKPKSEVTPFFHEMVDHIDKAWAHKKKAKFHWEGRFFKSLHGLANSYTAFGVMALFDAYLSLNDDWVRSTGYSFPAFISSLPRILDNPSWKTLRDKYQDKYEPAPIEMNKMFSGILKPAEQILHES